MDAFTDGDSVLDEGAHERETETDPSSVIQQETDVEHEDRIEGESDAIARLLLIS